MNLILPMLLVITCGAPDTLRSGYVHQIRADLALAEKVVLRPSPENGGGTFTIRDAEDLRRLARTIDRQAEVVEFDAKVGTSDYVVVEIFVRGGADKPDLSITMLRRNGLFKLNGQLYRFEMSDDATLKTLKEIIAKRSGG